MLFIKLLVFIYLKSTILCISESLELYQRNAVNFDYYPHSKWEIPIAYRIASNITREEKKAIQEAIENLENNTCIEFEYFESGSELNRANVEFVKSNVCQSYIGKIGGHQTIELSEACIKSKGTIYHEIGHMIGLFHEQNRGDRDKYVKVIWEEIEPEQQSMFSNYDEIIDPLNVTYDYGSVLHYSSTAYSTSGKYTLVTINPKAQQTIGQRFSFSFKDFLIINRAYCSTKCQNIPPDEKIECDHQGFNHPNRCDECICPSGFTGKKCDELENCISSNCSDDSQRTFEIENDIPLTLTTPNKIRKARGLQAIWHIKSPKATLIEVRSKSRLDLSVYQDGLCYDYIEIKQGQSEILKQNDDNFPQWRDTGFRFCNTEIKMKSDSNEVLIMLYMGSPDVGQDLMEEIDTTPIELEIKAVRDSGEFNIVTIVIFSLLIISKIC